MNEAQMYICLACGEISSDVGNCPESPPVGTTVCPFSKVNRGIKWAKRARAQIRAGKELGLGVGLTRKEQQFLFGNNDE